MPKKEYFKEHIFRPVEGIWRNVSSVDSELLSNFLENLQIEFPEHCEYAIYQIYELNKYVQIRQTGAKITIRIWDTKN